MRESPALALAREQGLPEAMGKACVLGFISATDAIEAFYSAAFAAGREKGLKEAEAVCRRISSTMHTRLRVGAVECADAILSLKDNP